LTHQTGKHKTKTKQTKKMKILFSFMTQLFL
jgi:hypothetical protein